MMVAPMKMPWSVLDFVNRATATNALDTLAANELALIWLGSQFH